MGWEEKKKRKGELHRWYFRLLFALQFPFQKKAIGRPYPCRRGRIKRKKKTKWSFWAQDLELLMCGGLLPRDPLWSQREKERGGEEKGKEARCFLLSKRLRKRTEADLFPDGGAGEGKEKGGSRLLLDSREL